MRISRFLTVSALFVLGGLVPLMVPAIPSGAVTQQELFNPSGLEIPRFVSLKSGRVFARKGPGQDFPIEWVYQRKNMPVEIIQEFDVWRKIRDSEGAQSWIHQSQTSGRRHAVALGDPYTQIFQKKEPQARLVALAEKGAVMEVSACSGGWCRVDALGHRGWAQKKDLWGIYESEEFR